MADETREAEKPAAPLFTTEKGGTRDPSRRKVAHEIRNSLGAMRTAAELLDRHYGPSGRERRLFEVLLKEIERLDGLVCEELGIAGR